jgi:ligand-binding sensor domain-containing protein
MKSLILVVFLASFPMMGEAQTPYFQQYFLLKKNEPVQVNAIFQDRNGIIWFGTNKGLFDFDGIRYNRFTKAEGLPDDNVTAICQDSTGRIWTGHANGSIAILQNKAFAKFAPEEGTSTSEISDMLFDQKGRLWFSTLNDGLYYYKQERLYRVDDNEGMPDLFVYDIAEDKDGRIWAGTDGGVAVCALISDKLSIEVLDNTDGAPDNIIKKIQFSPEGDAWMATEDAGITIYNPKFKTFRPMISREVNHGSISDFLIDGNTVWVSAGATGIVVYNKQANQVKVYNDGHIFSSINALLKDREGNIWAGSKTGVIRSHGDEVELFHPFDASGDNNILALTTDKAGQIWFSTRAGLFHHRKDASGKAFVEKKLVNSPYQKSVIISLYVDEAGMIWAGLFGEGVLRIDPVTGKTKLLAKELRNGNILNITGRGNVVWLATLGGGTKITYTGDQLEIKNYTSTEGLISDYVYQVFIDSKDRVWFATDGKGIDMLDQSGFHHFQDALPSRVVYGFAEDGSGTIWANVQANGIYQFDGRTFKPLPRGIKFRDNNIVSLATANDGILAVMHESGIDLYDPVQKKVRQLGEEIGIRDKKPNLNAIARDSFGRLYFGTESGIVTYANTNHKEFTTPQPVLRNLKIFDQQKSFSSASILASDENNLTLSYQGIWYQNPENINYRHRLENYDRDWIYTGDNSVTYSKLPPGEYTFKLQASDTDNFEHSATVDFHFIVEPPFWKTIPFFFIVGVLLIVTGYSFLKYRERKLTRDNLILEAKVKGRTDELHRKNLEIQAQNDEILTQNEEIQSQAEEIKGINENLEQLVRDRTEEVLKKTRALEEYAFINAHKLRAPVASVLGLINLMDKTQLDTDGKEINEHLKRSADELDSIVYKITKAVERGIDGTSTRENINES